MVHVKKCPLYYKQGRGKPTTEFYKIVDGKKKPQIYCYGWINPRYDEPLECCKNCLDWVYGEQLERDFEEYKAESENKE